MEAYLTLIVTCVGSRETPDNILFLAEQIASEIAKFGGYCRSGHADGFDYYSERGARERCIIYLPWKDFNSDLPLLGKSRVIEYNDKLDQLVRAHHPAYSSLKDSVKRLMGRNCAQVLGESLDKPTSAVVCWTPNGELVGGTSFAMRLAIANKIPIYNLYKKENQDFKKLCAKIFI